MTHYRRNNDKLRTYLMPLMPALLLILGAYVKFEGYAQQIETLLVNVSKIENDVSKIRDKVTDNTIKSKEIETILRVTRE